MGANSKNEKLQTKYTVLTTPLYSGVAVVAQKTANSGTGNLRGAACDNLKYSTIPELSGMLLRVSVQRSSMNSDSLVPRLVY